jgi:N-hydroxyarylamine O-acetyltransferase
MEIEAYLSRIKYSGPLDPHPATLRAVHVAHLQAVPFENLDIHLGRAIVLNLPALFEKIVTRRRGGFCYELNGLFAWLLQTLGFKVTLLSASDAQAGKNYGPEFDHLTLLVECPAEGDAPAHWLADVGWGDSFCEPLRLDVSRDQEEGLRAYRIDRLDRYHILWQRNYAGQWEKQYRFTLEPRQFSDYEQMCWYHQTSLQSTFTKHRICSLATPRGRISLDDQRLIVTEHGKRQERVVGPDEYRAILESQFGINLAE